MRLFVVAITFAVTIGGLFLFENYKTPLTEQNYAKIVSKLQQSSAPISSLQPTKTPIKTGQPVKQISLSKPTPSPNATAGTAAPVPSTTPKTHLYYTSSYKTAKYYYCDTDSGWKNLSPQTRQSFYSSEELLAAFPIRILHEPCK